MAIAAKISPAELTAQVNSRFVDQFFEARLINAPGTSYVPGVTDDATFLGFEVTPGTSGYQPQVISYDQAAVGAYSDDGIPLAVRATVFAHDGVGAAIQFSHVALVRSGGNATALGAVSTKPSAATDGTYTNIPVDSTTGSGSGLTVDVTVTNNGASAGDFAISIVNAGTGYADGDTVSFLESTLVTAGMLQPGAGNLALPISSANAGGVDAGSILSVAQTSGTVSLSGGNQAAFYWNVKQFGYYSVS